MAESANGSRQVARQLLLLAVHRGVAGCWMAGGLASLGTGSNRYFRRAYGAGAALVVAGPHRRPSGPQDEAPAGLAQPGLGHRRSARAWRRSCSRCLTADVQLERAQRADEARPLLAHTRQLVERLPLDRVLPARGVAPGGAAAHGTVETKPARSTACALRCPWHVSTPPLRPAVRDWSMPALFQLALDRHIETDLVLDLIRTFRLRPPPRQTAHGRGRIGSSRWDPSRSRSAESRRSSRGDRPARP